MTHHTLSIAEHKECMRVSTQPGFMIGLERRLTAGELVLFAEGPEATVGFFQPRFERVPSEVADSKQVRPQL